MLNAYGEKCPSFSTKKRWFNEFKHGRETMKDDRQSGRTSTSTDPDHVARTETLIMENRRMKVSEVDIELNVPYGSAFMIIHDVMVMSKVLARWLPRNLTIHIV
uniref:Mos1 transposase HTH domain-containing protein n=1 Tax=Cuerna arida TaxID=1464854 RepID=A0A1B6FKF4_9HEMI